MVDASTNMQAVAVEHEYGRPILPSFHGAWTLGGAIGAAIAIATADLTLAQGAVWLVVFPLAAMLSPYLRRDSGEIATDLPPVPRNALLMLGGAMVLFYMVDTASQTWDRSSSTTRSRRPNGWCRWRPSRTWWPAWSFGWPVTDSSRGTERCGCCASVLS